MKVILQQDVKGQGKKGQMIEASDGSLPGKAPLEMGGECQRGHAPGDERYDDGPAGASERRTGAEAL